MIYVVAKSDVWNIEHTQNAQTQTANAAVNFDARYTHGDVEDKKLVDV